MKGKSRKPAKPHPRWVLIACATNKERTRWRRALQEKFTIIEADERLSPKRFITKLNPPIFLLDLDLQHPGRVNALPGLERLSRLAKTVLLPGTQVIQKEKLKATSNVIHGEVTSLKDSPHQHFDSPLAVLSPRKQEIAGLIATGASNKEIANHLHISEATVKAQLTHIFRILHLSGRLQLALFLTTHVH